MNNYNQESPQYDNDGSFYVIDDNKQIINIGYLKSGKRNNKNSDQVVLNYDRIQSLMDENIITISKKGYISCLLFRPQPHFENQSHYNNQNNNNLNRNQSNIQNNQNYRSNNNNQRTYSRANENANGYNKSEYNERYNSNNREEYNDFDNDDVPF